MGRAIRPGVVRVRVLPVVEMPCRADLVQVAARSSHPAEGASYESESERGRDAPSSQPRARRNVVEVHCLLSFGFAAWMH
jgi:hypothetical protein